MQKIHYTLYLNPPRPTFMQDMIANDPANGLNKYEYYLMKAVTPKK